MSTFLSIIIGIVIGLATSVIGWAVVMVAFAPRVAIKGRSPDRAQPDADYQILVSSRRRRRSMIDVSVSCNLRIPHHGYQANMLTLQCSSTSFAFVPPRWARVITVSMDPGTLTSFGQDRLSERLAELEPPQEQASLGSLAEIFDLIPMARIDVAVFASDPISGARSVSRASLSPADGVR